ncbi:MAG TPA: hypothetical protein VK451_00735 [Methyloceanibacter sp.]|nr:hypothetical protein [Methyloceanibacter sp.]
MQKRLIILALPFALAGCAVGHLSLPMTLGPSNGPMSLGPSDTAKSACLTYADTPAYGDCKGAGAVSVPQQAK